MGVDADLDKVTVYYDGTKVSEKSFPAGHLAGMDCGYTEPDAYVALNHKPESGNPQTTENSGGMRGTVADWRMYVGTKLTEQNMLALATTSTDSKQKKYQECQSRSGDGDDSSFKDMAGHDCNWYQATRKLAKGFCAADDVKKACPKHVVYPSTATTSQAMRFSGIRWVIVSCLWYL